MNQVANIPCPNCKSPMGVEVAQPDLYNSPTSSVLVITHEHPTTCPSCFKDFTLTLGGVGQLALGLVPYVEKSKLVIPTVNGN